MISRTETDPYDTVYSDKGFALLVTVLEKAGVPAEKGSK